MRFLILTQYFHPEIGAAQVRLAALVRELQRLGHEVEVVTALPNYPQGAIFPEYRRRFYQMEYWENVVVHRVWLFAATGAGLKRLLNYFSFVITSLYALHKARKPDYVFIESPPLFLGITGCLVAKAWKIPFIFNVADLWPDSVKALGLMRDGKMLRLAEKLEACLYQQAKYVNAVTEGMKNTLITNKNLPPDKVLFLPNGVDTNLFKPMPPDLEWQERLKLANKQVLLYAGTHGYAHGMGILLDTAELLKETDIVFLLVGGGSEKARLEHNCAERQLPNVIFLPPQPPETIACLYSLAVAGISTLRDSSLFEGTRPVKILATMACGKPVIYSGLGEGADLVVTAQAGIVVPPQDAKQLVVAIQQVISDKDYAKRLGENGRSYVEQHLNWSSVVTTWLQHLGL